MTDINQFIEDEKRKLEAKLALISGNNLAALMAERKGYEAKIAEIDAKIQHICNELGIDVGQEVATKKQRRTRMSGADIDAKILEALKKSPQGISQIQISKSTGISYASVKWLKHNAAESYNEEFQRCMCLPPFAKTQSFLRGDRINQSIQGNPKPSRLMV